MALSLRLPRRRSSLELLLFLAILGGFIYIFILPHQNNGSVQPQAKPRRKRPGEPAPCSRLDGADDTVVVLKTSAAEIEDRLPIHSDTTLHCYPHHLIFSDYAENYQDYPVHDALATTDRSIRSSHPDFELWRRLRKQGPDGLEDEEIWNPDETVKNLDKWKYLPMVEQTFVKYPNKKWYVFLETDTYIFWSNLLIWLRHLDPNRPFYIGEQSTKGDLTYARSGSGIVLSHNAVASVVKLYQETKDAWSAYTEKQVSGDIVLGRALDEAGVSLTPAWPVFQSHRPADMDYGHVREGKRLWCQPTVSYHKISQANIAEMWKFEQQWVRENPNTTIHHNQIFTDFLLPRLIVRSGRVDDWDNFSGDFSHATPASAIDACRDHCVKDMRCVQFAYANGTCEFSAVPKMGESRRGVESRWLLARVQRFGEEMEECEEKDAWVGV